MTRKLIVALASLYFSKWSVAASAATGVAGIWMSSELGFDPWPWLLGALGGVIVRAKLPASSRFDGIANGIISVMMGGLGGPLTANSVALYYPSLNVGSYFSAFVLAAAWPWFTSTVKGAIDSWVMKRSDKL